MNPWKVPRLWLLSGQETLMGRWVTCSLLTPRLVRSLPDPTTVVRVVKPLVTTKQRAKKLFLRRWQ